ncbi:MAG: hypothetical protein QXW79_00490 [Thermoplasmata archaeon]
MSYPSNLDRQTNNTQNECDNNKNREICSLIYLHLKHFYDNICISYQCFKNNGWQIEKVVHKDRYYSFFNNKFILQKNREQFHRVFEKYVEIIYEILSSESRLYIFLKRWTDSLETYWKAKPASSKTYLKTILVHRNYQLISPAYIADLYCEMSKQYKNQSDMIIFDLENQLKKIIQKTRKEIRNFSKFYKEVLEHYVYKYPLNKSKECQIKHTFKFLNNIIFLMLNLVEKLVNLKIYAIFPIIHGIDDYYIPLDEIKLYNPDGELVIV